VAAEVLSLTPDNPRNGMNRKEYTKPVASAAEADTAVQAGDRDREWAGTGSGAEAENAAGARIEILPSGLAR
jgi:hypothetical protein